MTDTTVDVDIDPVAQWNDPLAKLTREVRTIGATLDRDEARPLVEMYYALQGHRIDLSNQRRALIAAEKPTLVVEHFAVQIATLERQMVSVLDRWTSASEIGIWSRSIKGIGPIIAAGFMAHIDIERAPTVGHIWRFAGLDPTVTWGKGQRRPWNADLKTLCWKAGDSFVKVSGREDAFYGQVYRERKALEVERNESGAFATQAAETLKAKKITEPATLACYKSGKLPAGRIDMRARRYAVKLFLSHWHEVAYVERYDKLPPMPYILTKPDHVHEVIPPNLPQRVQELRTAAGRPR